ncbi:P-loop containing nucleoside triphosphate hydrolase protein [Teratosphaeria nubilosa]|uniref:P-loop containing nucleoside triphosphate hydrolase protein n=1 Tax=Teratosphaeria nubilosa TaxID=161662 RepID=A0A6G1LJ22_9PEZI|nr:P-loop containing nucleoside triphosphate hydrolase protein [Teratosphaeria nubilosa]
MWLPGCTAIQARQAIRASTRRHLSSSKPIIHIENGTFYKRYPSVNESQESSSPIISNLSFSLPSNGKGQTWAVISPSSIARTTFLQILAGQHICIPPQARTYPYLSDISQSPQHAIKYVGFDAERGNNVGGTSVRGAYLSARYESRREETDFSVLDYLTGHTELNALEPAESTDNEAALDQVIQQLNLGNLLKMPVANLSNGQTRRARIAKALMSAPEVLLLDGPFMGLDPNTLRRMSDILQQLGETQQPRLLVSLRPEDGVPEWVSHLLVIDERLRVVGQGPKREIMGLTGNIESALATIINSAQKSRNAAQRVRVSRDGFAAHSPPSPAGETLVEMKGVKVAYGDKTVLGDWKQSCNGEGRPGLWWSLHRGQRAGIFGPNGSGKTTMLSLITSDHPQTYSLPIQLFGRSRLPVPGSGEAGISLFDIQRRMGHSSPEVHAFFPKQLTVRRALESAWADAPLLKANLSDDAKKRVNAVLRWFARELNPNEKQPAAIEILEAAPSSRVPMSDEALAKIYEEATWINEDLAWTDEIRLREFSFSNQRLILFLRALVAHPDLVILDEALSGVDETTRDKALLFLSQGEKVARIKDNVAEESILSRIGATVMHGLTPDQALLVISHSKEDVPGCLREWICLPEPGEGRPPRTGALQGPLQLNPQGWDDIWGK